MWRPGAQCLLPRFYGPQCRWVLAHFGSKNPLSSFLPVNFTKFLDFFHKLRLITSSIWLPFCCRVTVYCQTVFCFQCFDAVGWAVGRASGLQKTGGFVAVGAPLVRMVWRPPGLSVPLPPLSSPTPQKSRRMMACNNNCAYNPVGAPTCLRKQEVWKPSLNAAQPYSKAEGYLVNKGKNRRNVQTT